MRKYFTSVLLCLLTFVLFTGCGKEKSVDLNAVTEAVKSAYGADYEIAMDAVPEDMIEQKYGLTKDLYTEISAITALISVQNDEFVAVHAADGKVKEVEQKLLDYQTYLKENSFQYPANAVKVQASEVLVHGNYVFFVLRGPLNDTASTEEELLQSAKESNQKSIDAVNQFFK